MGLTAADKIKEENVKAPILANVFEERGNYEEGDLVTMEGKGYKREWFNGLPHKALSVRFLKALNIDVAKVSSDTPGGRFTTFMLDTLEQATACEALSVLSFAIEETVSTLYQYIWEGLQKTSLKKEDYVFFPLHILLDDGHADLLKQGFDYYAVHEPESCAKTPELVVNVMARRTQMFDEVKREILEASLPEREKLSSKISAKVKTNYLLKHNFLTTFAHGAFPNMDLAAKIFASNHFVYSKNFLQYLLTAADKIKEENVKAPILANVFEERGNYEEGDLVTMEAKGYKREWFNGLPHKALSVRFLKALNIDVAKVSSDTPGGRFTTFMLDTLEQATACEALSVLSFAIEETVSTLYQYIWEGLQKTSLGKQDYVFFPLHILLDDGHADLLKQGFDHYAVHEPESCAKTPELVERVMARRTQMFDEVKKEIEDASGL